MGPSTKKIVIKLDTASVSSLNASGQSLIIFNAVKNSDRLARPLIWTKITQLSPVLNINYSCDAGIFTSTTTKIQPNKSISMGFKKVAKWGEIFTFAKNAGGSGTFKTGAPNQTIGFANATGQAFICGLTQTINGQAAPYCAAPIAGNQDNGFEKREKVLLGFTSQPINVGEYIKQLSPDTSSLDFNSNTANFVTSDQLLQVDMAKTKYRTVTYDINKGWSFGQNIWGQTYPSNTDLKSILITQ